MINKNMAIIAGFLLLAAILPLPYGFYIFLRIFISICALFFAYSFYKLSNNNLMIIFGIVAIIFNPIFPIYLQKESWLLIDIIAAFVFFYSSSNSKDIL